MLVSGSEWQLTSSDGVEYFAYSPSPRLLLAFFTRRGGVSRGDHESLNTSFAVGDDAPNVEENLARARRALRLPAILTVKQTHSDTVLPVADELVPPELLEGDACITDRAGLGLGLKVADCLPVYIYAADSSCIGIAHCGWRGTAARLAEKTARQMSRRFSVPLSDLRFALGPCICSNCYEVGEDVRQEFSKSFPMPDKLVSPAAPERKGTVPAGGLSPESDRGPVKYNLDIRAANRWLLKELGLTEAKSLELCARENEGLFYSARRSKTTGRNLAVIALR
jgi:YfiH family protein